MDQTKINEQLKNGCEEAMASFEKIKNGEDFGDIQSKLEFVIGSYEFDKNPVGLHEFALKSLEMLREYKEHHPRKVSKRSLEKIAKSIERYENN